MIDMIVTKQIQIHLCQHIHVSILGIAVTQNQDGGIDGQQDTNHRQGVLVITEQRKQRHDTIAQSYTLHHRPDAQMTEAQQVALDGMVEPVDKQADSKQQHRTLNNATDDLWGWLELRLYQREIARDTHDKQEEGEHQVAGRHAVPL